MNIRSLKNVFELSDVKPVWKRFLLKHGDSIFDGVKRVFLTKNWHFNRCVVSYLKKSREESITFDVFPFEIAPVPYRPFDFAINLAKFIPSERVLPLYYKGFGPFYELSSKEALEVYKVILSAGVVHLPFMFHERASLYELDYSKLLERVPEGERSLLLEPPKQAEFSMSHDEFYGILLKVMTLKLRVNDFEKPEERTVGAVMNALTARFMFEETRGILEAFTPERLEQLWEKFNEFWSVALELCKAGTQRLSRDDKVLIAKTFLPTFAGLMKLQFMVQKVLPELFEVQKRVIEEIFPNGTEGFEEFEKKVLEHAERDFMEEKERVYKSFGIMFDAFLYERFFALSSSGFPMRDDGKGIALNLLGIIEKAVSGCSRDFPGISRLFSQIAESRSRTDSFRGFRGFYANIMKETLKQYDAIKEALAVSLSLVKEECRSLEVSPISESWSLELSKALNSLDGDGSGTPVKIKPETSLDVFQFLVPQMMEDSTLWRQPISGMGKNMGISISLSYAIVFSDEETFRDEILPLSFSHLMYHKVVKDLLKRLHDFYLEKRRDSMLYRKNSNLYKTSKSTLRYGELMSRYMEIFDLFGDLYKEATGVKKLKVSETSLEFKGKEYSLLSVVNVLVKHYARIHFLRPFEKNMYNSNVVIYDEHEDAEDENGIIKKDPYCRSSYFHGFVFGAKSGLLKTLASVGFHKEKFCGKDCSTKNWVVDWKSATRKRTGGASEEEVESKGSQKEPDGLRFVRANFRVRDLPIFSEDKAINWQKWPVVILHSVEKNRFINDEGNLKLPYRSFVSIEEVNGRTVELDASVSALLTREIEKKLVIGNNPFGVHLLRMLGETFEKDASRASSPENKQVNRKVEQFKKPEKRSVVRDGSQRNDRSNRNGGVVEPRSEPKAGPGTAPETGQETEVEREAEVEKIVYL